MIEIRNVSKVYEARGESHSALHDVTLTIDDGDIFGIIGASGAGKSTLVRCINLLERPTRGQIVIDGADVTGYAGRQLRDLRASIGMIFQNFSLFQQRTVLDNVSFPLALRHEDKAARIARARELLELVGLEGKESRYPSERLGVTMVVITHSLVVAEQICNRIAVIDDGCIVESGDTRAVFEHPRSDVTRELLGYQTPAFDKPDQAAEAAQVAGSDRAAEVDRAAEPAPGEGE